MSRITKNDIAWAVLFNKLPILETVNKTGEYVISAETINTVREARLMAKVDKYKELPRIMRDNGLYIISVANGWYAITKKSPFVAVPDLGFKKVFPTKRMAGLLTLDLYVNKPIKSESTVLNIASYNNLLSDCFGEHVYHTMNNRHRSGLTFTLDGKQFEVNGSQIDIDGCFEGVKAIHTIEVKTGPVSDVNIRQLLYTKREIEALIGDKKEVNSWLLTYNYKNKFFDFFKFVDNNHTYGFDLAQSKRYVLK